MSTQLFGESYLSAQDFLDNAVLFGCAVAVAGMDANAVGPLLQAASREVDVEVGRSFSAATVAENHKWDYQTRRSKVNQPPVVELLSFGIRVGAGLFSSFAVTPVEADGGGNKVRFGAIYYNRQENYLEVTALALAGSLINPIVSLGLTEPQVEIVYKSLASVPAEIALAVGHTAAHWLNENAANALILPGLAAMRDDDTEVRRAAPVAGQMRGLPARAKALLRGYSRIAVG